MNKQGKAIDAILSITPMIILIWFIAATISSGLLKPIGKLRGDSEKEHEEFMASVWKLYGRKQPQRVRG